MSGIELFNVEYRPGVGKPELRLLCQSVEIGGEKLLWIDGVNAEDPVMVPLACVKGIEWAGSFKEFMIARLGLAQQVLEESQGEHSPTIMARAMLYMSRDLSMTARAAIDQAVEQGVDLIDADNLSGLAFSQVRGQLLAA
jgi:hypothetical protein